MWIFVDKISATVVANSGRTEYQGQLGHPPLEAALAAAAKETGLAAASLLPYAITEAALADRLLAAWGGLTATVQDGQVTALGVDPAWQPPAPPPDPIQELAQVVARNVAASPHDRRFLVQKAIGKQAVAWIREHPACAAQEAEDYVMGLILAELPGEPVVPKLYWEHQGIPQGLAMSYLHEAIRRGYCPADTPLAWASLVGLIVATPGDQIDDWLRSL